jgi:hypothetical protein
MCCWCWCSAEETRPELPWCYCYCKMCVVCVYLRTHVMCNDNEKIPHGAQEPETEHVTHMTTPAGVLGLCQVLCLNPCTLGYDQARRAAGVPCPVSEPRSELSGRTSGRRAGVRCRTLRPFFVLHTCTCAKENRSSLQASCRSSRSSRLRLASCERRIRSHRCRTTTSTASYVCPPAPAPPWH